MTEIEIVQAITQLPTIGMLLFFYLRERARVREVTERHISDLRQLAGLTAYDRNRITQNAGLSAFETQKPMVQGKDHQNA